MRWDRPILTDTGGFQVMSLAKLRKITDEGVTFQSHIDGAAHVLTPERAIEIQCLLGADIQMQLDECVALPGRARGDRARGRALAGLGRALQARVRAVERASPSPGQALFGIVQGGIDPALRRALGGRAGGDGLPRLRRRRPGGRGSRRRPCSRRWS